MEKVLINSLLRIYHCNEDCKRHAASVALSRFAQDANIGRRVGTSLVFSSADRELIRKLLFSREGIDATTTHVGQWDGLSRAQSLEHSDNEKMTSALVRQERVAVKALPGRLLLVKGQSIGLPAGANLDINWQCLADHCGHSTVLIIENWEAFESVEKINFDLSRAGPNPLVVFRGCPVYRQDHTIALLKRLALPVFALVDYDPSGLVLAQSTPYFCGLLSPPLDEMVLALKRIKNHARYQSQLVQSQAALDRSRHPDIAACWKILQIYGSALPQEYFIHN